MTRDFKDMFLSWGIAEETGEMAALVHDLRVNERDLQVEWRKIEPEFTADCL